MRFTIKAELVAIVVFVCALAGALMLLALQELRRSYDPCSDTVQVELAALLVNEDLIRKELRLQSLKVEILIGLPDAPDQHIPWLRSKTDTTRAEIDVLGAEVLAKAGDDPGIVAAPEN